MEELARGDLRLARRCGQREGCHSGEKLFDGERKPCCTAKLEGDLEAVSCHSRAAP